MIFFIEKANHQYTTVLQKKPNTVQEKGNLFHLDFFSEILCLTKTLAKRLHHEHEIVHGNTWVH